jgi:hypothetical protein
MLTGKLISDIALHQLKKLFITSVASSFRQSTATRQAMNTKWSNRAICAVNPFFVKTATI